MQEGKATEQNTLARTVLELCIVDIKHLWILGLRTIKIDFLLFFFLQWYTSAFVFLGRLTEAHRTAVKVIRRMQYFVARRKFQVSSAIYHKYNL